VGTYSVNCTVYDTQGRSTSPTVEVTVQASSSGGGSQAPTAFPLGVVLAIVGIIGVAAVITILLAVKKKKH
jgi:hypothetical protein